MENENAPEHIHGLLKSSKRKSEKKLEKKRGRPRKLDKSESDCGAQRVNVLNVVPYCTNSNKLDLLEQDSDGDLFV